MLTTYDRLMAQARITRHRESTYDHRDPYELVRQLQAEVEALRAALQKAEGLRCDRREQEPRRGDQGESHA
jgi:hypothetical protein